jgi:hypothetical protein
LTVNHLPPHSHKSGVAAFYSLYGGGALITPKRDVPAGNNDMYHDPLTSSVGLGQPFDITPQFVAYNLCILEQEIITNQINNNQNWIIGVCLSIFVFIVMIIAILLFYYQIK